MSAIASVVLCGEECQAWHSKQFIADLLGVGLSTVYVYARKRGLPESKFGRIYCPDFREWYRDEEEEEEEEE